MPNTPHHSLVLKDQKKKKEEEQEEEEQVDTVVIEKIDTVIIEETNNAELDTPWQLDETRGEVIKTSENGDEQKAIVVQHTSKDGSIEEAITWVPADESWEMIEDQTKETRTNSEGKTEIGVQYIKTNNEGESESLIIWEPTMSKEEIDSIIDRATMKPELEEQPIEEISQETIPNEVIQEVEEVVKGNHLLELPEGIYLIAGVFEYYENANKFSDQLFLKGYHETLVGFVSEKGYYYVVIYRSDSLAEVKAKLIQENKKKNMNEIWIKILKVKSE